MGATTRTAGNAMAQDASQFDIQTLKRPSTSPNARNVETPDTRSDMRQERKKPKTIGEKRAGIMGTRYAVAAKCKTRGTPDFSATESAPSISRPGLSRVFQDTQRAHPFYDVGRGDPGSK